MKLNKRFIVFCLILISISTVIKIICAPQINLSGFTSIIAVAAFSGLMIKDKSLAFLLTLATLFISDAIIQMLYFANWFPFAGFYTDQLYNYALLLLITGIGMLLRNLKTPGIVLSVIIAPVLFFLISNYIVWATNGGLGYSRNFAGLMQCYSAGLPFYRNSLISTAIFLPAFIGLYHWMMRGKLLVEIPIKN